MHSINKHTQFWKRHDTHYKRFILHNLQKHYKIFLRQSEMYNSLKYKIMHLSSVFFNPHPTGHPDVWQKDLVEFYCSPQVKMISFLNIRFRICDLIPQKLRVNLVFFKTDVCICQFCRKNCFLIVQTLRGTLINPPRGTFWGKISTVGNWYFQPLQMGQNYYLARSTGRKCWIWKVNGNAWCILKIRACFQKCTGGFWRIHEGS